MLHIVSGFHVFCSLSVCLSVIIVVIITTTTTTIVMASMNLRLHV